MIGPFGDYHDPPRVHFVGIGGTAMVAGARLALEAGWEVRGSDKPLYPPTSTMVRELGVVTYEGFEPGHLDWEPDLVIIGNAFSRGNELVDEVLRRRIPYTSLAEWLKHAVLWKRRPVVIAGTHGKTTTTALTAFLLDRCGLGGGYLVGGQPLDFSLSSRLGKEGEPFVVEGDEYDTAFFDKRAKFFHYLPEIAVVTSVEFDHGDIYEDIGQIERAFRLMLRQIPPGGWLVACSDDPRAKALVSDAPCRTTTYGFGEDAHWRGEMSRAGAGFTGLVVYRGERRQMELAVPLAGRHNMQNTLAAVVVASLLGASPSMIQQALLDFRGVKRRMEVFLEARGMVFVDDFAHHPTAIRETLDAARERWRDRRIRVLLEPRSNTMVRNLHQDVLVESLGKADEVWVGPIYRRERIAPDERLDREELVRQLRASRVKAHFEDDVDAIVRGVLADGQSGDLVLILSNGAFGGIYDRFREALG